MASPFPSSPTSDTLQGCQIWRPKSKAGQGQAKPPQQQVGDPCWPQEPCPGMPASLLECQRGYPLLAKEGSSFFGMLTPVYEALALAQQELLCSPRSTRTRPELLFCSKSWHQELISSTSGTIWCEFPLARPAVSSQMLHRCLWRGRRSHLYLQPAAGKGSPPPLGQI